MKRFNLLAFVLIFVLLLAVAAYARPPEAIRADQQPQALADYDCTQVSEIPQVECEALVALYNATDGPNWNNSSGWLVTNTPCSWYGVTCTGGHTSELSLYANGLSGAIPPEIGNLVNLQSLYLDNNQLTAVPAEIGSLVSYSKS